ncbi:MAG: hypothetical protein PVG51_03185 [Desulfosarcina sp.]
MRQAASADGEDQPLVTIHYQNHSEDLLKIVCDTILDYRMNIVLVVSHDCFFDASNSRIVANIEMVETSETKNMQQLQVVSNERIYLKGIIFA